jgi:hypothetical protein
MPDEADLIPFHHLAAKLPGAKPGTHLHPAALFRWHKYGLRAADGRKVHLRSERLGGRWCTTWEWFREFNRELSEPAPQPPQPEPTARRNRKGEEALAQAETTLRRIGVLRPDDLPLKLKRAAQ